MCLWRILGIYVCLKSRSFSRRTAFGRPSRYRQRRGISAINNGNILLNSLMESIDQSYDKLLGKALSETHRILKMRPEELSQWIKQFSLNRPGFSGPVSGRRDNSRGPFVANQADGDPVSGAAQTVFGQMKSRQRQKNESKARGRHNFV